MKKWNVLVTLLSVFALSACAGIGTSPKGLEAPIEKASIALMADVKSGGYQLVDAEELNKWLTEKKDLVLIDTPGLASADLDEAAGLARFFAAREDIDTHLVLTASMKSTDLTRVIDAYERFRPRRLLFTRLDETGSFGPILNEAVRTGKPLSFFATGQRIPEDLEAASQDKLVGLVTAGADSEALSAA